MTRERVTITDDRPDPADDGPLPDPVAADVLAEDVEPAPLVDTAEIAEALRALGETVHGLAGHPDVADHWNFTAAEVAALAPPVTSIINRHAAARALAQRSPELAAGLVLTRWGFRNVRLTAAIREAEAELAQREADDAAPADLPAGE